MKLKTMAEVHDIYGKKITAKAGRVSFYMLQGKAINA